MMAPWPFAQWGLDIMGPFLTTVRQLKFLVVGIFYFTKWVEAKALATIMKKNIQSFIWRYIVYRFSIPRVLVLNNGKQFDNNSFRDFCSQLGIKTTTSPPPTLRLTDRSKSRTDPCSRLSRLGLRGQRVYGLKSCQAYYGHTRQRQENS